MSVSLVVPRRVINARLRLRFPPRKSADSGIPGEHRGIAPLHLVRRDVLDRMADHPVVAEGVAQGAGALPVEMILWRAQQLSTRRHGTLDHRVGVVDVKMDDEAAGRIRGRGMNVELRELVRQHKDGAAQLQLDMADAAAGLDETELLAGPENALVEVHRLLRGPGAQIDEELVHGHGLSSAVALRDRKSVV